MRETGQVKRDFVLTRANAKETLYSHIAPVTLIEEKSCPTNKASSLSLYFF